MRASRRSSFTVGIVGAVLKPLDVFVHVPGNGPSGYCGEASLVLLPRYVVPHTPFWIEALGCAGGYSNAIEECVSFDSCGFEELGQRFYLWPLLALIVAVDRAGMSAKPQPKHHCTKWDFASLACFTLKTTGFLRGASSVRAFCSKVPDHPVARLTPLPRGTSASAPQSS